MFNAANRTYDVLNRPAFITTDPVTMLHPTAMLHHRVSWALLCGTLNRVIAKTVDAAVVKSLLRLSPQNSATDFKAFQAVITPLAAGKTLSPAQIASLDLIEQWVFTLPCNLFSDAITGRMMLQLISTSCLAM